MRDGRNFQQSFFGDRSSPGRVHSGENRFPRALDLAAAENRCSEASRGLGEGKFAKALQKSELLLLGARNISGDLRKSPQRMRKRP